jgi:hypothetical protein
METAVKACSVWARDLPESNVMRRWYRATSEKRRAGRQRVGELRARRRETTSPGVADFERFPLSVTPIISASARNQWTTLLPSGRPSSSPDRKGSLLNNGFISPVSGHHALQYTSRSQSHAPHPYSDV